MIPVAIVGLHIEQESGGTVLLLREIDADDRVLPIFIGPTEARAIVMAANDIVPPRPHTHDLFVNVLDTLDTRLVRVDITDLTDGTFIAELELETAEATHRVSSRPSDAIALATRHDVPIYVHPAVLDDAGVRVEQADDTFDDETVETIVSEFQDFLATASPSDFVAEADEDAPEPIDDTAPADDPDDSSDAD